MIQLAEENEINMIIKSIEFENFKCFKSKQIFALKKLTILTGANSSGKSSTLYSILGALQTNGFPFQFSPNGRYIQMGDFIEISHKNNPNNKIKLNFIVTSDQATGSLDYNIKTTWEIDQVNKQPKINTLIIKSQMFDLTIRKNIGRSNYKVSFAYRSGSDPQATVFSEKEAKILISTMDSILINANTKKEPKESGLPKDGVSLQKYFDQMFKSQKASFEVSTIEDLRNESKRASKIKLVQFISSMIDLFKRGDSNINYISSFRLHPERTFLETSALSSKITKNGEGYIDQIVLWEKRKDPKFKKLVAIMKDLALIHDLKINRLKGGRYEIQVSTKENGCMVSLTDVGFGINQFLPIVVADLQLSQFSTLFISQPEIHLHPSAQSLFGDYLCKQIKDSDKNYLIETHSEYLLNRIRLAIVKGELEDPNLAVYYIDNKGNDAVVHNLIFDKKGDIQNAPTDFFDTYSKDMTNIILSS